MSLEKLRVDIDGWLDAHSVYHDPALCPCDEMQILRALLDEHERIVRTTRPHPYDLWKATARLIQQYGEDKPS